ncbi:hypothetical protein MCEMSEM29_01965 [Methylophilaceae bacterium]|jgi:hypothetical protein
MASEFLKSDSFIMQLQKSGKSPIARLTGLSAILNNWNKQRIGKIINGKEADLSIDDIQILKNLIENETSRLKLENAEIVSDQILFLVIGAIKLQVQNSSEKPWDLVNQSITNFLTTDHSPRKIQMSLYFLTFIVIMGFSIVLLKPNSKNAVTDNSVPLNVITDTSINQPGSETVSNLVELYKSMKNGDCALPQAAMLQPQEREAFISFVNEGKVDINTAENLKSALTYTNCLYPQKLMNNPIGH